MTSGLLSKLVDHEFLLLGWPKSSSWFSCNIGQKHPNELSGQPKRIHAFCRKWVHHYLLPATVSGEGISDLERVPAFSLRPPSSALPCHPLCLQPEGHRHSENVLTGLAQLQWGGSGEGAGGQGCLSPPPWLEPGLQLRFQTSNRPSWLSLPGAA